VIKTAHCFVCILHSTVARSHSPPTFRDRITPIPFYYTSLALRIGTNIRVHWWARNVDFTSISQADNSYVGEKGERSVINAQAGSIQCATSDVC